MRKLRGKWREWGKVGDKKDQKKRIKQNKNIRRKKVIKEMSTRICFKTQLYRVLPGNKNIISKPYNSNL